MYCDFSGNMVYGRTININNNVERISFHKKINFERRMIQANVHDKKISALSLISLVICYDPLCHV
jgi:hypothetical protein